MGVWFKFPFPLHLFLVKVLIRITRHQVHRESGEENGLQGINYIVNLKIQGSRDSWTQTVKRAFFYTAVKLTRQVAETQGDKEDLD